MTRFKKLADTVKKLASDPLVQTFVFGYRFRLVMSDGSKFSLTPTDSNVGRVKDGGTVWPEFTLYGVPVGNRRAALSRLYLSDGYFVLIEPGQKWPAEVLQEETQDNEQASSESDVANGESSIRGDNLPGETGSNDG